MRTLGMVIDVCKENYNMIRTEDLKKGRKTCIVHKVFKVCINVDHFDDIMFYQKLCPFLR